MFFSYDREKESFLRVLKSKAEKKGLIVNHIENQITLQLDNEKHTDKTSLPLIFKGKLTEEDNKTNIEGKFSNGFYYSVMIVVALVFILARLTASIIQKQFDNIILCGIVSVLLIIVEIVIKKKTEAAKEEIIKFLSDLNKK